MHTNAQAHPYKCSLSFLSPLASKPTAAATATATATVASEAALVVAALAMMFERHKKR